MATHSLLGLLRAHFEAAADPVRAAQQQAYMKSAMPFYGVANAGVRATCKAVFATYAFEDPAVWRRDVLAIWEGATHREERYAAIELTEDRRARPLQGLPKTARTAAPAGAPKLMRAAMELFETLIVSGAWWDYVDVIAAHRVGALLAADAATIRPIVLGWAAGDALWTRRAAILAQLGHKAETDTALLEACLAPALGDTSFWLRKAIGWGLREYAKTDADWVRAYVAAHASELSGLSRGEALKHLG